MSKRRPAEHRLLSWPALASLVGLVALLMVAEARDCFLGFDDQVRVALLAVFPPEEAVGACGEVVLIDLGEGWLSPGPQGPERCGKLARVTEAALAAGGCAVGLDVQVFSPGAGCSGDPELLRVLRRADRRVVVPVPPSREPDTKGPATLEAALPATSTRLGFIKVSSVDGQVADEVIRVHGTNSLALALVQAARGLADNETNVVEGRLRLGAGSVALREEDPPTVVLRWRPFAPVVSSLDHPRLDEEVRSGVPGRTVLIGAVLRAQADDWFPTPLDPNDKPGIYRHAEVAATLLAGDAPRPCPAWLTGLILLGIGVSATLVAGRLPVVPSLGALVALAVALSLLCAGLLLQAGILAPWAATLVMLAAGVGIGILERAVRGRQPLLVTAPPPITGLAERERLMAEAYPRPLAEAWFAAQRADADGPGPALRPWLDTVEVAITYCALLVLAELQSGAARQSGLHRLLRQHPLDRPSLGTLVGLWRDGASATDQLDIPELRLGTRRSRWTAVVNDLPALRNRFGHGWQGQTSPADLLRIRDQLREAAEELLFEILAFLPRYPLAVVRRLDVDPADKLVAQVERLTGLRPHTTEAVPAGIPLAAGTVCVITGNAGLLSLDPLILLRGCQHHRREELFFYRSGLLSGRPTWSGPAMLCEPERVRGGVEDGLAAAVERVGREWAG